MLKKVLLPLLIGVLALGQVVTGLVAASGIRADDRKAAALKKERAAVSAYRHAVMPFMTVVFDAVQPLQDADDALAHPVPGIYQAREDVIQHSGAQGALNSVAQKIKAVPAPKTLTAPGAHLGKALESLGTAVTALEAATHIRGNRDAFVAAHVKAFGLLSSAELSWIDAVNEVFGEGTTIPLATESRTADHGRTAATRGSFILKSDLACLQAESDLIDLPDFKDVGQEIKVNFPKEAKIVRAALHSLLAVNAPPSDSSFQHQLRIQLTAGLALPTAEEKMSVAFKASNQAAYLAAAKQFTLALAGAKEIDLDYKKYGATPCVEFFGTDTGKAGSTGQST